MIQLVYASAAAVPFTPQDLDRLLTKSRSRNTLFKVTGMLLYEQGSFLQVLEGPEAGVHEILRSIYKDKRHVNTRTLVEATIATREFSSWAMGFIDTSRVSTRPEGHVDYHRALPALTNAGTTAKRYLRFFQEGLYRQAIS